MTRKTNVKKHPRKTKSGRTSVKRHPRKIKALKSEYKIAYQQKGKKSRDADELETSKDLIVGDEFDFPAKKTPQNKTEFLKRQSRKFDWEGIDDSTVERDNEIMRLAGERDKVNQSQTDMDKIFKIRRNEINSNTSTSGKLKNKQLADVDREELQKRRRTAKSLDHVDSRLRSLENRDL